MGNFFTSLFSSKKENDAEEQAKNAQKKFDILKYDGVRAQKIGRIDYAIKCYTEALNIQEDVETMNYLAGAYSVIHQTEKALEVLNRMVELEPDNIQSRLARVGLLFLLDKDEEVIADCLKAIELDETNPIPYYLKAKAQRTLGNRLDAMVCLTKAISLKADFMEAYLLRAEVLLIMRQGKEALEDVERAIALAPEEETAYLMRGQIYEFLDDNEAAATDYQRVLDLNPFNEDAVLLNGNLLIEQGQLDEAITLFDEAIEIKPEFSKAFAERGRAKNLKGDKEGAYEDMKMAIALNPTGAEAKRFEGQHSNFGTGSYLPF